ncbi:MAG: succinylglutamate desuccinylase/aspartoacylase family protein [Ardenticatenaceae bacterium]|nr:succinylglutamate desuccinylase/aspartoacylase family protein [Ardenticatenaceae bacterium]
MKAIRIGSIEAFPGRKTYGELPVSVMASGHTIRLPIHVVRGSTDGPCVGVVAVQHGHEFSVLNIQRRLLQALDPAALRGTVICVPIINPIAFEWASRGGWSDGLWGPHGDIGRLWPGDPDGWLAERIAYAFATQVLPHMDALFDFHGDAPHTRFTDHYIGYSEADGELGERTATLGRIFGMQIVIRRPQGGTNTLTGYAMLQGVPAFGVELGDFYGLDVERDAHGRGARKPLTDVGVRGITNVLRSLDMLDGDPELPDHQVEVSGFVGIAPSVGGIMAPEVTRQDIGRVFPKGYVFGRVLSAYTFEELGVLRAPLDQNLLVAVRDAQPFTHMQPGGGDLGFSVVDWSTARWLRGGR